MSSEQWFYRLGEKQLGPVDYDSLQQLAKAGVLSRTSLVWKEGMVEWVPASTVRGIFSFPPPAPNPAVPASMAKPPAPVDDFVVLTQANLSSGKSEADRGSAKPMGPGRRRPVTTGATSPSPRNPALIAGTAFIAVAIVGFVVYLFLPNSSNSASNPLAKESTSPHVSPNGSSAPNSASATSSKSVPPEVEREERLSAYDRIAADEKNQAPLLELQRRLDELAGLSDSAGWQTQVQDRRGKLQQLKEARAGKLIESLGKSAVAKADAADFQGAVQEIARFPKELEATDAGARLLFFRKKIGDIAQGKLSNIDAAAAKLAGAHDLEGALRMYTPLSHLNSTLDQEIAQRQSELRDIASVGLDPFSDVKLTLKPAQQYLSADAYAKGPGMIEKLSVAVKDAISGSPEGALEECDLAHYPRSAIFYYAHALTLIREGNTAEANADKDQARRMARPSPDFETRLQCLEIRLAVEQPLDDARANELLRRAQTLAEQSPSCAEALFVRGLCLCRLLPFATNAGAAEVLVEKVKETFNAAAQLDPAYESFATAPDPYSYSGPSGNPYIESVVLIYSQDNQESRLGTGFVVGNGPHSAFIITNHHVIAGAKNLHVGYRMPFVGSLSQRESTEVKTLADDPRVDLALLEIPVEHPLKALALRATTTGLEVPMKVTLIGHPKGLDYSVLSGELSNLNREVGGMRYLQVNANVEPGMSGGPVIDANGNVVGVTVMKFNEIEAQGLAIISERVRDMCAKCGIELVFNTGNTPPPKVPDERPFVPGIVGRTVAPLVKPKDDTQKGDFILTFKDRSPFSAVKEQGRRLHTTDIPEDYDLSQESFRVVVPEDYDKANGYGLVVWLDTFAEPILPDDVKLAFQKHGLICISPKNCDAMRRTGGFRIGLPIDAAFNLAHRYTIDEKRIYAIGLGVGAETATRLGLLYPDVFTGGLFVLNCDRFKDVPGSQPNMGWRATFTPDAQLFTQARQNGRFVLIAGERSASREMMKSAFTHLFTADQFPNASYVEVPALADQMPPIEFIEQGIVTLDKPLAPAVLQAFTAAAALEKQGKQAEALLAYEIVLKHCAPVPEISEKARDAYQSLMTKKETQLQDAKNAIKERRVADAKSILESYIKNFEPTKPGEAAELLRKLVQSPTFDKSMRDRDAEAALANALQLPAQDFVKQSDALELVSEKYPETTAAVEAKKRVQAIRADRDKAARIDTVHAEKKADALLQQAKNFVKNGLNDDAKSLLQEVVDKYPNSISAAEAKRIMSRLP